MIRPGGVLALSTPNVCSLRARQEGPAWYGFEISREHLLFFSIPTLVRTLNEAGFEMAYVRTRKVEVSIKRLLRIPPVIGNAPAGTHSRPARGMAKPADLPVRAMLKIRELALKPMERFGMGHVIEMYGLRKPSVG